MKKVFLLFAVLLIVPAIEVIALDIGVRLGNAPGIAGATSSFADSTAVIMNIGFSRGLATVHCFGGAGLVPQTNYSASGERTQDYIAVPLFGIEGAYAFPLGRSVFSLPVGLECRAAFPSAEIARTAASVALSSTAGVRADFGDLSLDIAGMIELSSFGFDGSYSTFLDRHLMGLSCGLAYSLR